MLRADVDGDGRRDTVSVRVALRAPTSCAFVLLVSGPSGTHAARIPEPYDKTDGRASDWNIDQPTLGPIVQLTPRGAEVVVELWRGAAVAATMLYGIHAGRLETLRFPWRDHPTRLDLFGTVGTGDVEARCIRGRRLVLTARWGDPAGKRWHDEQTSYALRGPRFAAVSRRTSVVPIARAAALERRWGVDVPPFAGCVVVRGQRL